MHRGPPGPFAVAMSALRGAIVQINISAGGIPKLPIGDDQRNKRYHGGPRKALLLVSSEVIDQLRAERWPVFYGALGENLTT